MAKFLYYQDAHAKGKNSIYRLGNYFSDWLIKFDELISIALDHKCEVIIDGGDLFDSPIVSYSVCDAIIDKIEKSGLIYYCLFGNHAERYHSKEHSFDTTLAHILRRSKNFKYLNELSDNQEQVFIKGFEYSHNVENEIKEYGLIFPNNLPSFWKIAVVHAFITPESFPFASHIVCDDIKTNADLVLVAHYHKCWQKKVGKTEYLDIGCFGRNSITEADIIPKCVLFDTEIRSYSIIPLNSAKAGHEIFDLSKIQEYKILNEDIDKFIKSIESIDFQVTDLESMIKFIGKEKEFTEEPINYLITKLRSLQNGL